MTALLDIALSYVALGWAVVPIAYKQKRPSLLDWQSLRISADDAPQYFNGAEGNIGVILGAPSGGLTDIDLDCDEAVRAAPYLLPRTRCFGRETKRASHWLYYTNLSQMAEKATLQWKEGPKPLLECRVGATGAQTVFPPSTHPSGETVAWEDNNPIAEVDGDDLLKRCERLATVALLARRYPEKGIHEAALVIGGFLAGCGFGQGEAKLFAEAVCAAASLPPDRKREIVRTVCDTVADAKAGRKGLFGWPKLKEIFGEEAAKKCAAWLGFKRDDNGVEPWPADLAPGPARDEVPQEEPLLPLKLIDPSLWAGKPVPVRQWLVEDWIPSGVVTGLYGDGGIGKTLLLQQLQASAATGLPWLGLRVEECVSIGVYCEDSEDELHRRMADIVGAYSCEWPLLSAMPMIARMGEDNLLMVFDSKGRGELTPFHGQLRELVLDMRARILGIDTASDTFAGNEIDRGQVRQFVQRALGSLALAMGGAVVLLAHPSVAGMASGEGTGGSTGWNNAFRSRLYLKTPEAKDGEPPDSAARLLTRKKANYAPRADTIDIRWDRGVLRIPPPEGAAFRRPCEDVYLDLLAAMTASGNVPSPKFNAPTYAPTMFSKLPRAEREGYFKGQFEAAQTALFKARKIKFEEVGPPARRRFVIQKTETEESG